MVGLDAYEKRLHKQLEVRARAVRNWHYLKNQVMIVVAFNKDYNLERAQSKKSTIDQEEQVPRLTCSQRIAPYIIDPNHRYKVMWDITIAGLLLLTFFVDPYHVGFWFEPLEDPAMV